MGPTTIQSMEALPYSFNVTATIRLATDEPYIKEQIKILRGRAGMFRNKVKEVLGVFHHR